MKIYIKQYTTETADGDKLHVTQTYYSRPSFPYTVVWV